MKVAVSTGSFETSKIVVTDVTASNPLVVGGKYKILNGGADVFFLDTSDKEFLAFGPSGKYSHNWEEFTVLGSDIVSCSIFRNAAERAEGFLVLDSEKKMYILADGDFILWYLGKEEQF